MNTMIKNRSGSMRRFTIIIIGILFAIRCPSATQTPRAYPCYFMAEPPVIDGKTDEAVWKNLPVATGFYLFNNKGFAVKKPTSFRIGWTKNAIYLAARCHEPFSHLIMALTADGDPLWDDDSVEVFLSPMGGADYFQFIANTAGMRWNGRKGQEADKVWNWSAKARIVGDEWTLEMRIPFKILEKTPAEDDTWRFNVARNVTCGPANERYSSWAPVKEGEGFGDTANFAALTFRGAPAAGDAAAAERQMGEEFQKSMAEKSAAPGNFVVNGSFEDGLNGWGLRRPDHTAIDPATVTIGNKSIRLDGATNSVSANQRLKLKPATKYILRCDIKRTRFSGVISVDVLERDSKDDDWTYPYHRCGDIAGRSDAPNAWGHYELRFQTSTNMLESILMLENANSAAVAWYDGIELVEDDGADTADTVAAPRVSTVIRLELEARDASVKLVVNGENVTQNPGKPLSARIQEGLTVIGIDAQAHGPNPGVKARIAGDPLTDTRWRVSTQENPAWTGNSFDDNGWPMVLSDAQSFMWATNGAQRVFLRQVVLWNKGHDGPDRCINPLIREWGISEGAMENMSLLLYSPFPFALDNYEFILDVPTEFRLLDIMQENRGVKIINVRPAGVATERTEHGGEPYTRYRIAESKTNVGPDRITGQLLPLFLEKRSGTGRFAAWCSRFLKKWFGREHSTAWFYRRVAKGNFTELEQKIPVRVLPPINGRFCKKIMISQYCSDYPWSSGLSSEHYEQHMRQSFQAGFNTWIAPKPRTAAKVLKAGGRIIIWSNYPFYGMKDYPSSPGYRWLNDHPAARVRYFNDNGSWSNRDQYCPSYVTGEGRGDFLAEVKKVYEGMASHLPGASIIWTDWEEVVWFLPDVRLRTGKESWCFCDRCKAEFRTWANLPAETDLSDAAIFKNYRSQWQTFRSGLDGKVAAVARQAANELGKSYLFYAQAGNAKLWAALKGNIDLAFPGIPGAAVGTADTQKNMDSFMAMCRDKIGLSRSQVMGQTFASQGYGFFDGFFKSPASLKDNKVNYEDPKLQKRGILRVVAAFGLGVDLCTSIERSGGMLYWIGEATRILAAYEDLFHEGERDDALAACDKLNYPDVLVLKRGGERLVLLFNEGEKPLTVTLRNKDVKSGQTATVFGTDFKTDSPAEMTATIPEQDVVVVHIR